MDKFFVVMVNGKHTQQEATIEMLTSKGYTVNPSRRFGKFDVFSGVNKVATLFDNKLEAAQYLELVKGR